jgi:hypothetical protein
LRGAILLLREQIWLWGPMDLHKFHEAMNARSDARNRIDGVIADMTSARSALASAAGSIASTPNNVERGGNVFARGQQAAIEAEAVASRLRENDQAQQAAKTDLAEALSREFKIRIIKIAGGVVVLILLFWLIR